MNTIEKGRQGEALAISYLVSLGYDIFMPIFGNAINDMIVTKDSAVYRVEIKTTDAITPSGKYIAQLRSVRHNNSANTVKKFDSNKSDILIVVVLATKRVHVLDSKNYDGNSTLTVEG